MGELTNNSDCISPEMEAMQQKAAVQVNDPGKISTDVENVYADGTKDNLPVFNIDHNDFMNTLRAERKRLRFKSDTAASQYLRGTKYARPFYLQSTDAEGKRYLRKVSR